MTLREQSDPAERGNKGATMFVTQVLLSTFRPGTGENLVSLSEQEMRALREIEQSLLAEDPQFGHAVAKEPALGRANPAGQLTMRSVALIVLGIVLLLAGVALASWSVWTVIISVLGFGVMMAGGIMALRTPASTGPRPQARRASAARSQRSVSMEESFRRRFEDRQ